ncbi:MAG TPA: radical SAM protein, partial [Candidatus Solibacter sp.]|nr:radical SAM protein [Candidatus Solibacter sp.]
DTPAGGLEEFAGWAARRITMSRADVYGLSSICNSYPVTIRIAQQIRRLAPSATIMLGGPQASVVDRETLSAFGFVDFVLRGEAEESLPRFLEELQGNRNFGVVGGLTYRSPFGVNRASEATVIEDLDTIPLPAFHLLGGLRGVTRAHVELGRGCPFACNFCSTNDFFRRKFRVKSPQRMLRDMRQIAATYGIRNFGLTHDMFTVDRRRVVAFCEAMLESGEDFTWSCSARTDCVDEELLELMARAGCRGIFFGVESGSNRMQRIMDKGLDIEQSKRMITAADALGIETTVALITGFPEENAEDARETVRMFTYSLRHAGSTPQMNILAPLAGTPIFAQYRDRLTLDELCSDMSHQGRKQNAADRELIRRYPAIFPNFYLVPCPGLDRDFLLELREFLLMAAARMRWLITALDQAAAGFHDLFAEWRSCRLSANPVNGGLLRQYYTSNQARKDFLEFVKERADRYAIPQVGATFCFEMALLEAEQYDEEIQRRGKRVAGAIEDGDIPIRASATHLVGIPWDLQGAIDSLRTGQTAELDREFRYYRTVSNEDATISMLEISNLMGTALQACDGSITAGEFTSRTAAYFDCPPALALRTARCLLDTLCERGLLEIYRPDSGVGESGSWTVRQAGVHQTSFAD